MVGVESSCHAVSFAQRTLKPARDRDYPLSFPKIISARMRPTIHGKKLPHYTAAIKLVLNRSGAFDQRGLYSFKSTCPKRRGQIP